jgi:hypothetical protein
MTEPSTFSPSALQDDREFLGDGYDRFAEIVENSHGATPGSSTSPGVLEAPPGQIADLIRRVGLAVLTGWICIAVGVVLLIVGYLQVSSTSRVAEQLSYLSAQTAAGMFVALVGSVLVISQHYRTFAYQMTELRREQREMIQRLES